MCIRDSADLASEQQLKNQLLRRALQQGKHQAETTSDALGLKQVRLLRIDQRGDGSIRRLSFSKAASSSFNPDEAPQPRQSLTLNLDYCLS